ncbi:MAG: hypothetical protein K6U89_18310, partial [Chloroflexi bacterium]|nr:hypothetical protein [Chloroflexota bacterium]
GYLWVDLDPLPGRPRWMVRNVWVQGRAELIEDEAEIAAFFARRQRAHGHGDAHPEDRDYRRILIRVTPEYLRAEGFGPDSRPVILRDFSR